MCVTSTSSIAATGQTTSATHGFHCHLTRARALLLKAITHRTKLDATIIRSIAHIRWQDSVTTGMSTAGRKVSVTRLTVTSTPTTDDVTYLTTTVLRPLPLTKNVTFMHPGLMTAVPADCLMVSYTLVHVTTNLTARSHSNSPVTANATKIRLQ